MIIPTYNEAENIERDHRPGPRIGAGRARPGRRRQLTRRHRQARRPPCCRRRPRPRDAPARQGGARRGVPRRLRVGARRTATTSWSRWTPTAPTSPSSCPCCWTRCGDADLVLGSRWVQGGRVVNWPRSREVLSRGGNLWTRIALGIPLKDATGGYRAFRRETLLGLGLDDVASAGYCFQVDLAWRALKSGFRVVEVPITFVERRVRRLQDEPADRRRGAAPDDAVGDRAPRPSSCAGPATPEERRAVTS